MYILISLIIAGILVYLVRYHLPAENEEAEDCGWCDENCFSPKELRLRQSKEELRKEIEEYTGNVAKKVTPKKTVAKKATKKKASSSKKK